VRDALARGPVEVTALSQHLAEARQIEREVAPHDESTHVILQIKRRPTAGNVHCLQRAGKNAKLHPSGPRRSHSAALQFCSAGGGSWPTAEMAVARVGVRSLG
jgi:hypothetical protein